jgi:hypothetical protein
VGGNSFSPFFAKSGETETLGMIPRVKTKGITK